MAEIDVNNFCGPDQNAEIVGQQTKDVLKELRQECDKKIVLSGEEYINKRLQNKMDNGLPA